MEWDKAKWEWYRKRCEEKKRLLALTDAEAELLPVPDRYQRIRYLREDEGIAYVEKVRRNFSLPDQNLNQQKKPKQAEKSKDSKIISWGDYWTK